MRRGFKFLQGWSLLHVGFTPQQRRVLVSGMEDFGADAVVRILVLDAGWEDAGARAGTAPTVECLHKVLRRFEDEDKDTAVQQAGGSRPVSLLRRFVQFATGRSAITQNMTITLRRHGDDTSSFPEASTCVSELRMPDYRDAELLYERLKTAICSRGDMADD